jgi:hypothetical protein
MKLKNMTNKLVTICGVNILPGKTEAIPDEFSKNGVVDFFVKTNRLTVVAEKTTRKTTSGKKSDDKTAGNQEDPTGNQEGGTPSEGGQE